MALPEYKPRSPLEALSLNRFGGRTYGQEKVISVTTTRTLVIPNNPNRLFWAMINEGANDVRVTNDPNVTASSGWVLAASGGVISMYWEEDGEAVGYEVFALTSAGASNVRVKEIIRE